MNFVGNGPGDLGGLDVISKFGDHENTVAFALQFLFAYRLLRLRVRFLGLRGKLFGWFRRVWM